TNSHEWEPFLNWVIKSFSVYELLDQEILPIRGGGLAAASKDRVFLPPIDRAKLPQEESETAAPDEEEQIELQGVPIEVISLLNFLDSTVISIRHPNGRTLTDLSSKLAPDSGTALVRRPRLEELINEAVAPAMAKLTESSSELKNGLTLLALTANCFSR